MIRHPEPPPRALPLRLAIILIGTSVVLAVIGVSLTAWASANARHHLADSFEQKVAALEAQVTAMCQSTPDPATCKPVTQAPIVLVVPGTTMVTPTTTIPFPPSTLAPATTTPANPPASAAQAPAPAPQPSTTTTTATPPPTTTPPTTAPCTSLPVVGCVTRASRSATRSTELDWEALRQCENSGSYTSKPSDTYRGAYQADRGTWDDYWSRHDRPELVGTDPAGASAEDQDSFAFGLFAERGRQPWPTCGRLL